MEYYRTDDNQIQASFAYRIGKIAHQYSLMTHDEVNRKYEITLNICLLQSLLTQCQELIRAMSRHERRKSFFSATLAGQETLWGLRETMIKVNTFSEELTYEKVIKHIRDSLSHPTKIDINADYPSTGFTTPGIPEHEISEYIFVSSPDTRGNRPKECPTRQQVERILQEAGDYPPGVTIKEDNRGGQIRYFLWHDGRPFARIFRIDIPIGNLNQLVLGLSNHLAQPTREVWDEINIKDLIAA